MHTHPKVRVSHATELKIRPVQRAKLEFSTLETNLEQFREQEQMR